MKQILKETPELIAIGFDLHVKSTETEWYKDKVEPSNAKFTVLKMEIYPSDNNFFLDMLLGIISHLEKMECNAENESLLKLFLRRSVASFNSSDVGPSKLFLFESSNRVAHQPYGATRVRCVVILDQH